MYLPYKKGALMAERKPKVEVVVEDEQEKKAVAEAAERAGFDSPGEYIRALLQREGVSLRQQQRGGWRGRAKEGDIDALVQRGTVPSDSSGLLCIELANTH